MPRLSATKKLEAVKEVLEKSRPLAKVASEFGCTRPSLYLWINQYRKNPQMASENLRSKYLKGNKHPKRIKWQIERQVLDLVVKHPDLSLRELQKSLLAQGIKISLHGLHNVLVRNNLQTDELRHRFSLSHPIKTIFAPAISPANRLKVLEEYLDGDKPISQICRIFNISRPTFYSWLSRFKTAKALEGDEADLVSALARHYKRGYANLRSIGEEKREIILDIVGKNPELSVHKLYATIPRVSGKPIVGHHAIQNLFLRENLNTIAKRREFAQSFVPEPTRVSPLYQPEMPTYRLRQLIAPFMTVPRLAWLFTRGQVFLVLILLFVFYSYKILSAIITSPTGTPVGIFFAAISLTFGIFFFIYSMKYYLATLLVLRLAQTGGAEGKEGGEGTEGKGVRPTAIIGLILSRLGLRLPASFSGKAGFSGQGGLNPLLVNLEKVTIKERPFVSVHVAVYNEKRVVERLIRACTRQDWHAKDEGLRMKDELRS